MRDVFFALPALETQLTMSLYACHVMPLPCMYSSAQLAPFFFFGASCEALAHFVHMAFKSFFAESLQQEVLQSRDVL